ncbi:MAG TPA: SulP family inorganic anion transporter [Myxococcaceae bacterium]|nr:SulP family inorganic anion transporter [Myxococcaceae bacterium]
MIPTTAHLRGLLRPKFDLARYRSEWLGNVPKDLLAGITVALALIPESIGFSIIAGVEPQVALYASFTIAAVAAFLGGRPGMVSAATGAMALVMVPLVASHGLEYLLAATVLTGVLQVVFRLLRLSRYIRYVPRPVMSGFVNALALLLFLSQLDLLAVGEPVMWALVVGGLAIIHLFPRLTRAIPAPLVAVVLLTGIIVALELPTMTVGNRGALPASLPSFHVPMVPFTLETLQIIFPYAFALAMVGLTESLLTASIVDELTDTPSNKHTEAWGQGVANIVTGFFGGMAGCAMVGQSAINVRSGGRGRLSTFTAGAFLLFLVVSLGDWVARIPTGALVAVMITVAIDTFDWKSVRQLRVLPVSESLVMLVTVATVVATHDLSKGVLVGVLLSALLFARSVSKGVTVDVSLSAEGRRVYTVRGNLFFVSVESFLSAFESVVHADEVELDFTHAQVWDTSAVSAIERVRLKLEAQGSRVSLSGLDAASLAMVERFSRAAPQETASGPSVADGH